MAKRRPRGEGNIRLRQDNNLWLGQVTLPTSQKKVKYGKTHKEVRAWLEEQPRLARQGLVARNLSEAVDLPPGHQHQVIALAKARVAQLWQAPRGDRRYPFSVLRLSTGLRKGEALALTLDCVNPVFEDGTSVVPQMQKEE
jgi:hypothetical protein